MHRHGTLVLTRQQSLGRARCASTATQLKPRAWATPTAGPSNEKPPATTSGTSEQTASSRAAALRAKFGRASVGNADANPGPMRPPSDRRPPPRDSSSQVDRRSPPSHAPRNPAFQIDRRPAPGYTSRDQTSQGAERTGWTNIPRRANENPSRPFENRPNRLFAPDSRFKRQNDIGRPINQEAARQQPQVPAPAAQTTRTQRLDDFPAFSPMDEYIPETESPEDLKSRQYEKRLKSRPPLVEKPKETSFSKPKPVQTYDKPKFAKRRKGKFAEPIKVDVYIPTTVSVANLARILQVKIGQLQRKMEFVGIAKNVTHDYVLTADYAALIAEEFGRRPVIDDEAAFDLFPPNPHPDKSTLPFRPPIVTIMGHVDHGKTTLLDSLRSTAVAKGEAGGITQHIGAFSVPVKSESAGVQSITFLDTPGHAAFSAMRARGAGVTDIIVLVVAADDGLMPQTKEVIELYKKHEDSVGLVVAINKVDKPSADVESVQKALMAEGIQLEVYGGDTPSVLVSGLTGQGLPDLVETLSLVAEMKDLRAEVDGMAYGEVLESRVQQGLGMVGTVLVTRGSLKVGSHIISGQSYGKVRRMTNCSGATVAVAKPGMAVTVSGWKTLPQAGDDIIEGTESDVKKALANRERKADIQKSLDSVDALNEARRNVREQKRQEPPETRINAFEEINSDSGMKELRLVIKADVSGSAEAVQGALEGIGNNVAISRIISTAVGDVSESDVMLAKAANANIVAFSVGVPRPVQAIANQNGVTIISSNIIYKLMDEVRERVRGLLPMIIETKVTGEANVLQLFDINLKAKIFKKVAGCRVTNGLIEKSKFARLVRDGETLYEGSLDTLKHVKKDVTEVRKGTECGLSFEDFTDIREGDIIQTFDRIEKQPNF